MPSECGCKPGTFENGWMEERSEECLRAETEAFARALRTFARFPDQAEIAKVRRYFVDKDVIPGAVE